MTVQGIYGQPTASNPIMLPSTAPNAGLTTTNTNIFAQPAAYSAPIAPASAPAPAGCGASLDVSA